MVLWSPHLPTFLGAEAVSFEQHSALRPRAAVGASSPHWAWECCEYLWRGTIILVLNEGWQDIANAGMG